MLKNQSLDNKEKCEFNMISCFSCWTNTIHTSPVMKLVHWQYCFMKLWILFLLRWAFQTQLTNSKPQIFSCFMGGGLQILQLLWWTVLELSKKEQQSLRCLPWQDGACWALQAGWESNPDIWSQFSSEGMEGKIVFVSHAQLERVLCLKRFFQYK